MANLVTENDVFLAVNSKLASLRVIVVSEELIIGQTTNYFDAEFVTLVWDYHVFNSKYVLVCTYSMPLVGSLNISVELDDHKICTKPKEAAKAVINECLDKLGKHLTDKGFYVEVVDNE